MWRWCGVPALLAAHATAHRSLLPAYARARARRCLGAFCSLVITHGILRFGVMFPCRAHLSALQSSSGEHGGPVSPCGQISAAMATSDPDSAVAPAQATSGPSPPTRQSGKATRGAKRCRHGVESDSSPHKSPRRHKGRARVLSPRDGLPSDDTEAFVGMAPDMGAECHAGVSPTTSTASSAVSSGAGNADDTVDAVGVPIGVSGTAEAGAGACQGGTSGAAAEVMGMSANALHNGSADFNPPTPEPPTVFYSHATQAGIAIGHSAAAVLPGQRVRSIQAAMALGQVVQREVHAQAQAIGVRTDMLLTPMVLMTHGEIEALGEHGIMAVPLPGVAAAEPPLHLMLVPESLANDPLSALQPRTTDVHGGGPRERAPEPDVAVLVARFAMPDVGETKRAESDAAGDVSDATSSDASPPSGGSRDAVRRRGT